MEYIPSFYDRIIKRWLDFAAALTLTVLLAPVFLAVALLVRMHLGSPVIFRQPRPGKDGRIFDLYKFRTMTDRRDDRGALLPDGVRLTPFGKWLRATSLDELPELWNILRGEMSFVGPRPLLVKYLPLYSAEQQRRHLVRPGLTGWAQIHGRNAQTWQERFRYDLWYVDRVSLLLDLRILLDTVGKVFRREGTAPMPEFQGNREERI